MRPPESTDLAAGFNAVWRDLHLPGEVVYKRTTLSTQTDAKALARAGAAHGTAVIAGAQSQGRGRLQRTWISAAGGNLYLSIVLRPTLPVAQAPLVSLAAAVAVASVCGPSYRVKWPNDVMSADVRKVAGILAEMEIAHGQIAFLVLGMGINLTHHPTEIKQATSLAECGQHVDEVSFVKQLLPLLLAQVQALETHPDAVLKHWQDRSVMTGARLRVGERVGIGVGLDRDGALLLRDDTGQVQRILAGDVEMIATLEST